MRRRRVPGVWRNAGMGMVGATFLVEYLRTKDRSTAWRSTVSAMRARGWTTAIELIAALTAATAWAVGLFFV